MHTHRTTVDGEKKSPTVITPRCPDNRRELRVHATTVVVVVVVVVVITYSRVPGTNQPEGCQSCSHDQLTREKIPCPRSRLKIWFCETDLAVPSRVSLLILHTQAKSGAYSRDCSRCPRRHPYIFPTPTTIQSMFKYKILVLLYCCCTDTFCCHNIIAEYTSTGRLPILFKTYRGTMYYSCTICPLHGKPY